MNGHITSTKNNTRSTIVHNSEKCLLISELIKHPNFPKYQLHAYLSLWYIYCYSSDAWQLHMIHRLVVNKLMRDPILKALFGPIHFNSYLFMVHILTLLSFPIPKGPNLKGSSYAKVATINTMESHNGSSLNNTMMLKSSKYSIYFHSFTSSYDYRIEWRRSWEGEINDQLQSLIPRNWWRTHRK